MRIFINNVDSYVGQALCADLRNVVDQENRLLGTVTHDGTKVDADLLESIGVKRVVSRADPTLYLKDVLSCSLIIYDLHSADLADVERVIKYIKVAELSHDTTFVLISSVNVWARTAKKYVAIGDDGEPLDEVPDEIGEDGERREVKKRPAELSAETDLERRIPSSSHEAWKYLETLTLSLGSCTQLRPHVIAAGTLYGNGETVFNELFKAAWLTRPTHAIIAPGDNYIPCVHVRDVARLVRTVAGDSSSKSYLIAVDMSRLKQSDIVQAIVNQMSHKQQVPLRAAETVHSNFKEEMCLDLIMKPCAALELPSFAWWCRDGITANIGKLASEFCKWRNLRPIKTIVVGPPGAGAQTLGAMIAKRYLHEDPPHFTFERILQDAMQGDTAFARKLRRKVEKLAKKPPGTKLPLKLRTKLIKSRLLSNVCRYRGYVLEGYPTCYEEAEALFMELVPVDGEEEKVEEEEEQGGDDENDDEEEEAPPPPADEEEEDDSRPKKRIAQSVAPEFVVLLTSSEDRCKARIFNGLDRSAGSEEDFRRRTLEYRQANLAEDGRPGSREFFTEISGTRVLELDVDSSTDEEAFQAVCIYLEAKGQFFNYLRSDEELARESQAKLERGEAEAEELSRLEQEELEAAEKDLQLQRGEREAQRKRVLAEAEAAQLEAEATPLRKYLLQNVVPTLTRGLTEVCKEQPEDPIEFLAQYLFAHAQEH